MLRKTSRWLLLVIFLAIIFIATIIILNNKKSNSPASRVIGGGGGVGTVFSTMPIEEGTGEVSPSYTLKENHFKGYYYLENNFPTTKEFSIIALLDYIPIPLTLDGVTSKNHRISIKKGGKINKKFSIKDIPKGFHDFTIIAFRNLYNKSLSYTYRIGTNIMFHYPQRANLFFGRTRNNLPRLTTYSQINNKVNFSLIKLSKNKFFDKNDWLVQKVKSKHELNFYIQAGNISNKESTFVIMLFINSNLVPISKSNPTAYGKIAAHSIVSIPIKLVIPTKKGIYNIFALKAISPFKRQKQKNIFDESIISSLRTALQVY